MVYSLCAIERVGSLVESKMVPERFAAVLRPGGVLLHTTEFSLTSLDRTVEAGDPVIWRKRDVEEVLVGLRRADLIVGDPCWYVGSEYMQLRPLAPRSAYVKNTV
jgi:hypothetical protein